MVIYITNEAVGRVGYYQLIIIIILLFIIILLLFSDFFWKVMEFNCWLWKGMENYSVCFTEIIAGVDYQG